ncbi:MAG: hypothetical protein IKT10_02885 [Clostridiales bacterium]|nr:hypothetical protein [Clostridiales bacterium]
MMDYESFKKRVMREFLDYMPEKYQDCELELRKVPKINTCLTGVVIKPKGKTKSYCSPTFYMERMYDQYLDCDSFEKVMANQAIYLEESLKYMPEDVMKLDFASMKEKIVFQVVNTKENQEMISLCPHRDFMDLSIVYRVIVNVDEHGVSGFLITHDIANVEDLTEGILYRLAKKNTKKIFPFKSERIEETMSRMMKRWGATDKDVANSFAGMDDVPQKERVYVVSNEYEFFGANALLYTDVLKKVVKNIGTDCYILPSSVHDLVVLSTETFSESSKLISLVRETNSEHVRASDRLSDSIYKYSIENGTVERVEDEVEEAS